MPADRAIGVLIDQGFNYHRSDNDTVVCLCLLTLTSKIFHLMQPT